eukprot:TRINITY_DN9187_c0_g1_i6.p1 TRINITY_DN9187_c0_g1~~TRINITY_DN9187_c0_g1_i6.p1  ORF type:complete len:469 (+),score=129.57 TRINITY_DN9187_c0_g1_i6:380-1786(+)
MKGEFLKIIQTPPSCTLPTEFSTESDTKATLRQKVDELSDALESLVGKQELQNLEDKLKTWIENKLAEHKEDLNIVKRECKANSERVKEVDDKVAENKSYMNTVARESTEFKQLLKEEMKEAKDWMVERLQKECALTTKGNENMQNQMQSNIEELREKLKKVSKENLDMITSLQVTETKKLRQLEQSFNKQLSKLPKANSLNATLKQLKEQQQELATKFHSLEAKCETFLKSHKSLWETIRNVYDKSNGIKKTIADKMAQLFTELEATKNCIMNRLKSERREEASKAELEDSVGSDYNPLIPELPARKKTPLCRFSSVKGRDLLVKEFREKYNEKNFYSLSAQSDSSELFAEPLELHNAEEDNDLIQLLAESIQSKAGSSPRPGEQTQVIDTLETPVAVLDSHKNPLGSFSSVAVESESRKLDEICGQEIDEELAAPEFGGLRSGRDSGLMASNTICSTLTEQPIVDA